MTTTKGKGKVASGSYRLLSMDRDALMMAVAFCAAAIKGATTLPVLYCVRLRLAEGGDAVVLEATNLDQYVETRVPCEDLTDAFDKADVFHAVPAKLLHSALSRCQKGEIEITMKEREIMLGGFTIVTLDGHEFPSCPDFDAVTSGLAMDPGMLARCARFVAAPDSGRPALMGVHLGGGRAFGSDGKRGHVEILDAPADAYVPVDFAAQVSRMTDPVISITKDRIRAVGSETGQPVVTSRQMDCNANGNFLNALIQMLEIPKEALPVSVEIAALVDALQSAQLMVSKETQAITISSDEDELMIQAEAMERGSFARAVPIANEAFRPQIGSVKLNVRFLLEAVAAFSDLEGDQITLHVLEDDGGSKIWIKSEKRTHIMMCMR